MSDELRTVFSRETGTALTAENTTVRPRTCPRISLATVWSCDGKHKMIRNLLWRATCTHLSHEEIYMDMHVSYSCIVMAYLNAELRNVLDLIRPPT